LIVLNQPLANPLNGGIHRTFIKTHELKAWTSLSAWESRRLELIRELKDKVFRGFPETKTPFDAWKSKDGGWPSRYTDSFNVEFTTEQGIRVSGQLFIPRDGKPSHPALIYVKGADDVIYPVDFDPVLPAFTSHVVLILQPRAVDYPGVDNYKMSNIRMSAALIGSTIESMQLWDLVRAVDYLVEGEGLKLDGISVYGRKQMGAPGIYAAALDARLTRVILDDPPASHWQGLPLLFVLRITDLAETAGLVAPREIVSIGPLPAAYSNRPRSIGYTARRTASAKREAWARH
jgi:hypothetical protein